MNELTSLGHLRCQHMIKACQRRGVHVYEHQCSRAVNRNTQNRYCFQHLCQHDEEPRIVEQGHIEQGHNHNHCSVTIKARTGKPEHQCTRKAHARFGGMCSQHHKINSRNQHVEHVEHIEPPQPLLDPNEECCICYEPLGDTPYLSCCKKNRIHYQCLINAWVISRKKECPLCRSSHIKLPHSWEKQYKSSKRIQAHRRYLAQAHVARQAREEVVHASHVLEAMLMSTINTM